MNESNDESQTLNSLDFDFYLIFGVPDRAIDVEVNVDDNRVLEALKHSDESTLTQDNNDLLSSTNSSGNNESLLVITNVQVEGDHLNSSTQVEGEHTFKGGEKESEGSEIEEMFEDAPLDFDPTYPPMDRWTRIHPKELLGDPHDGVLTRAQLRANNEV
ncbi:uncharacterized protein LOC111908400 isoform X2 [Lactuca sativa]|nr:uncharacterized protein LOC111908400 isoform X2 [Lactuca sativa]